MIEFIRTNILQQLILPHMLYITGMALLVILVVILCLSVVYYWKAKNIAPYLEQRDDLLRAIGEAQKTIAQLNMDLQRKQNEAAMADQRIAAGEAAKQYLENNAGKIDALRIATETEKEKFRVAQEAYGKRQDELDLVTQQVADKHGELKICHMEKDALDVESARLNENLKSINASLAQNTEDLKQLDAKIDVLRRQKNELDAEVKDLQARCESLKKFETELQIKRSEVAVLEGAATIAKQKISELDAIRNDNKECWRDLDRPFVSYADIQKTIIPETTWLDSFQSRLKKYNLIFSERTVRAFHTGLKCADISPLVVLAGISGTGKSLLPELYAASLGMNFLAVAVQPRWDSPHDLFGFYNYMEGKYKATELLRLLWQFDYYNNDGAKNHYKHQQPMNMVLLDEMNIARVEYYFSDLLSKLEIRHGLDPEDESSRRKAEIELECNAGNTAERARRLFVHANTLFVGTMNEDESTQTLSDKVLDRANVLRFGRPKDLGVKPQKSEFLKETCRDSETNGITFQNWREWQKPNQPNIENMYTVLASVNDALNKVGRPFAHRVWQAIESYVALYPGSWSDSIADQIEMKILPKLNGLELDIPGFQDVVKTMKDIMSQLDDKELLEAFDESCDAHNTFFKWRGVNR